MKKTHNDVESFCAASTALTIRSQVGSYLAHTGGLCPEEGSVLRSRTTFYYAQDHIEQSRLKSLLIMRNETPERKAKSEGECFETHTGPESSKNNGM